MHKSNKEIYRQITVYIERRRTQHNILLRKQQKDDISNLRSQRIGCASVKHLEYFMVERVVYKNTCNKNSVIPLMIGILSYQGGSIEPSLNLLPQKTVPMQRWWEFVSYKYVLLRNNV